MKLIAASILLITLVSCGDDEQSSPEPTAIAVTLTSSSIDGLPEEVAARAIEVAVTDRTTAGGEINFTRVEPGTDAAAFADGLLPIFGGGPFPDFLLDTVGATGSATIALDEGEYIAWIDLKLGSDEPSTAADIITAPLTVTSGVDGAEITGTDGTITATDYHFTVEAAAGASTLTFNNDSDDQFHHVLLVDFGTNDPDLVEATLPELLLTEEDAPLPDALDTSQVNYDFARTPVYGPGASGTFEAPLEAGHTYVALCFISDRDGGAPHAMQHNMSTVFQV